MHSRVPKHLFRSVAAVMVAVVVLAPGMPAGATEALPFEVVFPQDAAETDFRSTFGDDRSGGRIHKGNDLLAPRMTEVYAFADGTITYVGINDLSGRNIKIDHGDGWETFYLHLNNDNVGTDDGDAPWALTVAPGIVEGLTVEAGELIGWVGDSGNAETTTPHTHFELRHDGEAIDPYDLLVELYVRDLEREKALAAEGPPGFGDYVIE